jgi:oligoribonuclease
MTDSKHEFLWLDYETTGLHAATCQLLEWAIVLAADDRDGDMRPITQYEGVIHVDDPAALEMDPYVRNMHTKNGLLDACAASDTTLEESDAFLAGVCAELGAKPRQIVLAGASVHFDLAFARVHMPKFAEYLSHRVFDVSTLKRSLESWGPTGAKITRDPAHRAMPDVLESLSEAAQWRAQCAWVQGSAKAPVYHRWVA